MKEAGCGGIRGRVCDQHQAIDGLTLLGPSCALVASMIGAMYLLSLAAHRMSAFGYERTSSAGLLNVR